MDRYPHSIVWTPLPVITWCIPLIGHTGIANSEGVIYDFGGSQYIAVDNFTFGSPTKYLRLESSKARARDWDDAIQASANRFCERNHNLVTNNCHSHVADTLNEMCYNGRSDYTQLDVFIMMTFQSRYVGLGGFLRQWAGFLIVAIVITLLCLQYHETAILYIKLPMRSISSIKSLLSEFRKMRIFPVKALQDNYMYLLVDETTHQAAAIDPVDASAMINAAHDHKVQLKAILTTHHHYDHAHGNSDMLAKFPSLTVYGGDPRVQALNKSVSNGDVIKIGNLQIECIATPCHTKGHICYYVTQGSGSNEEFPERAVFTGDTLFIAGCGRFFEGSSEQMCMNLNHLLASLPDDTKVYCGHEYTVTNLKFALSVEPQNADIKTKLNWAQNKVAKKEPTIPSTIGEEKKINPFMRLKHHDVMKFTGETDELEVMTVLRHRKNEFKP